VAIAVYSMGAKLPYVCPRDLEFDIPTDDLSASLSVSDVGDRVELTLEATTVEQWTDDDSRLNRADAQAHRIMAALCFHYAAPFVAPLRTSPPSAVFYDLAAAFLGNPELRRAQAMELPAVLEDDDPTRFVLWQVFASTGASGDSLSQFVSLWGLLDVGLEAENEQQIDDYLVSRFGVPRDQPDRSGHANRETKFAHLRHSISHPSGRGVESIQALAGPAASLTSELTDMCRAAVREDFKR